MEDAYPIAWVLAFPLSNERNAAVANQSLLHTMKCTDIEAQENNVSLTMFMSIPWNDFLVCNHNTNKSSSSKES